MKRYIKANMLGPAFNLNDNSGNYTIGGYIWNDDEDVYDLVRGTQVSVNTLDEAVDTIYNYLNEFYDYDTEAIIVDLPSGKQIEIRNKKFNILYKEDICKALLAEVDII